MIIDEMGKASARAQDLKMPITTAEKLSKSDHIVYLLSEQTNEEYVFKSYNRYPYNLHKRKSIKILTKKLYLFGGS